MSDFMNEQLHQTELSAEYSELPPEMEYINAILRARRAQGLTQKQLAERSGIRQPNISRIESGVSSPTISTLQKIADGLGKQLHIEFI